MEDRYKSERRAHRLSIANRKEVAVEGVVRVDSFDDTMIVLETDLGMLTVKGQDLHIKQLDLEAGSFLCDGTVESAVYSADGAGRRPKGFLQRILR